VALRRSPPPPGLRVVVMSSGQPVPAVARSSPFVLGVVRKPRHPAEAAGLISALAAEAERPAGAS